MIDYGVEIENVGGDKTTLKPYEGQVLLIVNTASKCGMTPQFDGLEKLYQEFKDSGFCILGFPCNQFAGQDPESNENIESFCRLNYGVTFPMHAKIEVNGSNAHPLFQTLKTEKPGLLGSKRIKWNFTKFLVARDGSVIGRYGPKTEPSAIADDIRRAVSA